MPAVRTMSLMCFRFPFCDGDNDYSPGENLGEVLFGDRISRSPIEVLSSNVLSSLRETVFAITESKINNNLEFSC